MRHVDDGTRACSDHTALGISIADRALALTGDPRDEAVDALLFLAGWQLPPLVDAMSVLAHAARSRQHNRRARHLLKAAIDRIGTVPPVPPTLLVASFA